MFIATLFLFIITTEMVRTIPIGRVHNACLTTTSNSSWLYQQTNLDLCLCTAMSMFNSQLLAINYFSTNESCQLFLSSSYSPGIITCPNSTLILLRSLSTSSCSNTTLLLQQIKSAQQPSSTNVTMPTFLSISSVNNNLLSVMPYKGVRTLLDRKNLSKIVNTTNVGLQCAIASQYGNLFTASCDDAYLVKIYNETISGLQLVNVFNATSQPRQTAFVRNNTWMIVPVLVSRTILFYSLNPTTNQYRYNQSISSPYGGIWSITKHTDTLLYVCYWTAGTPVHVLSYNGVSWTIANLSATTTSSTESPAQVAIDKSGRIWLVVYGFGVRIYDATGQILLASWSTISTTLSSLLILDTYEMYFGDYDNNKILHFAPNLQCTS